MEFSAEKAEDFEKLCASPEQATDQINEERKQNIRQNLQSDRCARSLSFKLPESDCAGSRNI